MTDYIRAGLHRIEAMTRKQSAETINGYEEYLRSRNVTESEMAEAVLLVIDNHDRWPSVKQIMGFVRGIRERHASDDHPVWDQPRETPIERARIERAKLAGILDVYRRQKRPLSTLDALERDLAKLDREIALHEQLAQETIQMSETEAAAYGVRFWGGEKHMPNILKILDAGDEDRNLRGPEQWDGSL